MKVSVTAHPNSRRPRIDLDLLGNIHVYVQEPPLDGKANNAIRDALASHFNVRKYQVDLISGEKSKQKIFEIF